MASIIMTIPPSLKLIFIIFSLTNATPNSLAILSGNPFLLNSSLVSVEIFFKAFAI